jgi:hypothetical protein
MENITSTNEADLASAVYSSTARYTAIICLCLFALHAIRLYLIPRPIQGIPHNKSALANVLGDGPELTKFFLETGEVSLWLLEQIKRHKSPIIQAFIGPFSKPWVVIADFQETQDICLRRTREFDRSPLWADIFAGLAPLGHIHFPSNSAWKAHRRLLQDLMLPAFLNNVAAPAIHSNALDMLRLWDAKCRIADGRPFDAEKDIFYVALDAVNSFTFGAAFEHRAITPQLKALAAVGEEDTKTLQAAAPSKDSPIHFPKARIGDMLEAVLTVTEAVEGQYSTLFPKFKWWRRQTFESSLRNAVKTRRELCRREIARAVAQLDSRGNDESWTRSAIDLMVRREKLSAANEGRKPQYYTDSMIDEVSFCQDLSILSHAHNSA